MSLGSTRATAFQHGATAANAASDQSTATSGHSRRNGQAMEAIEKATLILAQVNASLEDFAKEHRGALPKRSVVLLGDTGVGKTSLVHALAGSELRVHHDLATGRTTVSAHPELPGFSIGSRLLSETAIPRVCACIDRVSNEKVSVFDFPGLEDNRGTGQEIANAICMQKILASSPNSMLLVLIDDSAFVDTRASVIMSFLSILEDMLSEKVDAIEDAISLVVTHAEPTRTTEEIRRNIERIIHERRVNGAKRRLLEILSRKIAIFRKPPRSDDTVLSTAETVRDVFKNVRGSSYAQNITVKICLSEKGKHEAHSTYVALVGHIDDTVSDLIETFSGLVKNHIQTLSEKIESEDERKSAERKFTSLLEMLSSIGKAGETFDQLKVVLEKCSEIAHACGGEISRSKVQDALQKADLAKSLTQFLDAESCIPSDVDAFVRSKVDECKAVVLAAQEKIKTAEAEDDARKAHRDADMAERALMFAEMRREEERDERMLNIFDRIASAAVNRISQESPPEQPRDRSQELREALRGFSSSEPPPFRFSTTTSAPTPRVRLTTPSISHAPSTSRAPAAPSIPHSSSGHSKGFKLPGFLRHPLKHFRRKK